MGGGLLRHRSVPKPRQVCDDGSAHACAPEPPSALATTVERRWSPRVPASHGSITCHVPRHVTESHRFRGTVTVIITCHARSPRSRLESSFWRVRSRRSPRSCSSATVCLEPAARCSASQCPQPPPDGVPYVASARRTSRLCSRFIQVAAPGRSRTAWVRDSRRSQRISTAASTRGPRAGARNGRSDERSDVRTEVLRRGRPRIVGRRRLLLRADLGPQRTFGRKVDLHHRPAAVRLLPGTPAIRISVRMLSGEARTRVLCLSLGHPTDCIAPVHS